MHDIDRTQLEYASERPEFEDEQDEFGAQEWNGESEDAGLFGEADESELASELLEVTDEAELDQFLGRLLGRAAAAVGAALRSPSAQALGGVLKGVLRKAVPLAGGALGAAVGGPLGAQLGSGLASAAGSALGLEAESEDSEDREFEGARQFVRLAADTVAQAAAAPASADPRAVAHGAAVMAARRHAPGLLSSGGSSSGGQWVRRGSRIVLYGV